MRAHFSYKASDDPYIPCKEAGLDFSKGDVLHIVSQDDAYWYEPRIPCFTGHVIKYTRLKLGGRRDERAIET